MYDNILEKSNIYSLVIAKIFLFQFVTFGISGYGFILQIF